MTRIPEHYDDVGPGWAGLLTMLHTELLALCSDYVVHQLKEKFGTLRVYIGRQEEGKHPSMLAYAAVHRYEAFSGTVCEVCGHLGENREDHHWWRTRCEEHQEKRGSIRDAEPGQ